MLVVIAERNIERRVVVALRWVGFGVWPLHRAISALFGTKVYFKLRSIEKHRECGKVFLLLCPLKRESDLLPTRMFNQSEWQAVGFKDEA